MKIAEMFYSIQGEGISTGFPAIFIRFPGCNLMCGGAHGQLMLEGKATWHCDSEKVWRESQEYSLDGVRAFLNQYYTDLMKENIHIIFTGGEPCLPQNAQAINQIIDAFPHFYYEIETNGTLYSKILERVQQINCSPKLANSGMPLNLRVNKKVQEFLTQHENSWWKFVVSCEEDYHEALATFPALHHRIILMPACDSMDTLSEMTRRVWEIAMKFKVRMCSRIHILSYNKLTGV